MAKKPKRRSKDDQLERFKRRAEEIGAEATEEEFARITRKIVTSKLPKEPED